MRSKKFFIVCIAILLTALLIIFQPTITGISNRHIFNIQKTDDVTNYETIKRVEDTARGMIVSYNADKLVFEQYRDSENKEEKSWSNNAKIRANRTATQYNEFILKNSFVWKDNLPEDIFAKLEILK